MLGWNTNRRRDNYNVAPSIGLELLDPAFTLFKGGKAHGKTLASFAVSKAPSKSARTCYVTVCVDSGRIVAVVPVAGLACPGTAWDWFAAAALETPEPIGALRICVTLSSTCLQAPCIIKVPTRQHGSMFRVAGVASKHSELVFTVLFQSEAVHLFWLKVVVTWPLGGSNKSDGLARANVICLLVFGARCQSAGVPFRLREAASVLNIKLKFPRVACSDLELLHSACTLAHGVKAHAKAWCHRIVKPGRRTCNATVFRIALKHRELVFTVFFRFVAIPLF